MALQTSVQLSVDTTLTKTDGLASASADVPWTFGLQWADGTGAGQADRIYQARRTLTASASENLDLAGVLVDTYGATVTFARIKLMIVKASAANTNSVVVGGAATNPFVFWTGGVDDSIIVRPGGLYVLATGAADTAGYPVTAGTGDLLKIANSSGGSSVTYDIILVGASA